MVRKLICGVGLNDADYVTQINEYSYKNGKRKQKKVWTCPFYRKWTDMINRGYSIKLKLKHPTYKECSVCEEWQNEILEKCSSESHLLTFRIAEAKLAAGYELTQVDVMQLQKMLMESCLVHFNVVI